MIPSITWRRFRNGRPRIPSELGNIGSIKPHCASVNTASRVTPTTLTHNRHHIRETRPRHIHTMQDRLEEYAVMIIVYGGCQADEPGRDTPRLPSDAAEDLFVRIRGLLNSLDPKTLVGALASGADIAFARAALAEGIPLRVLLPFDVATFRRTSVEPAGEPWISHYDRITSAAGVAIGDAG